MPGGTPPRANSERTFNLAGLYSFFWWEYCLTTLVIIALRRCLSVTLFVEDIIATIAQAISELDSFENTAPQSGVIKTFEILLYAYSAALLNVLIASMPACLNFLNITATLAWSYSDLFIVCISLYLSSILEGINNKLVKNKNKYSCSKFWVSMREDYSRAAQLVRAFDDVTCVVVFASFATNLIFICLQLYNLLSPLGGYENVIYFTYSMVFVLFRYLSVSLVAARVHTSSQSLAPALYGVPSSVYNVEVQRFLDQVQHDTVALSGLQFFYVTKSLVLTVAGTIFTYELVLLQYGG
ncbi:hypothetical protein MSG28_000604 [Choristoneura fumiferana]|uniref:Uncharacterized protein n=2 Tax=Choristoneura fumiferana TaxID=7141 RepID=A0ACC0K1E3_CHOFU|nr:hypothetical protein MSG28_000604 [Choristoneura fumiferana]